MKKFILFIVFASINSVWAECLIPANFKLIGLSTERVFRVSRCSLPQINTALAELIEVENGTRLDSFSLQKTKLEKIQKTLAQDYREYRGSAPLDEHGFALLQRFTNKDASSLMQHGEIIEAYKNEKGTSDLITFFNRDYSLLVVITKFKYAN